MNITCDDALWFFADGQEVIGSYTTGYNILGVVNHVQIPGSTTVYGIKCQNRAGGAGIIASFSDGTVTNHEDWR